MLPTTVSGTRLNSAKPSDIEFLSSFLTDLAAVVAIKGGDRMSLLWRNLDSVKAILSEALGYRSVEGESEQLEPDSDTEDETWVEDWGVQELLEWMLLEVRRAGLPDEKHLLQGLIGRLEQRISTTPDTSSESRSANAGPPEPATETTVERQPKRRRLTSSISLLPTELFYKIFESVCSPRILAPFSPLILSHVNSYFRSIVVDMSSLWSTIDGNFPLPIAKLYLERSIPASLDIRIGPPALEVGKVAQLFQYLEPHAHRVKALRIVMEDWDAVIRSEELMNGGISFGGLEKFEFGRCSNGFPNDRALMFTLDEPASLQELHLWGYEINQWIDTFHAALRRLHLTEAVVWLEDLGPAVEVSPVEVLVLEDCNLYWEEETAATAGSLVELQFIMINPGHMDQFASCIHTPALASLSVVANTAPGDNNFLVNLVKNSKDILSIEICDYDFREKDWLETFAHLPRLTHLRIRGSSSSNEDLQALSMAQTLPNLTFIALENELRLTTLLVEQIARARPELESIVLRGWDPSNVSAESLAEIRKLVKDIYVETLRMSPAEDGGEDTESDSNDDFSTEGSWLSGDEHIAVNAQKYIIKRTS